MRTNPEEAQDCFLGNRCGNVVAEAGEAFPMSGPRIGESNPARQSADKAVGAIGGLFAIGLRARHLLS